MNSQLIPLKNKVLDVCVSFLFFFKDLFAVIITFHTIEYKVANQSRKKKLIVNQEFNPTITATRCYKLLLVQKLK